MGPVNNNLKQYGPPVLFAAGMWVVYYLLYLLLKYRVPEEQ